MCKYCDDHSVTIFGLEIFKDKVKCSILLTVCASVGGTPVVGIPMGITGGITVSGWVNAYIEENWEKSKNYCKNKYPNCCSKFIEYTAINEADENFSEFWRVGKRMLNNNVIAKIIKSKIKNY